MPATNQGRNENTVLITRADAPGQDSHFNWSKNKLYDYGKAVSNTYQLLMNFDAKNDPNAFHHLLQSQFDALPEDEVKILEIPVLAPGKDKICQRIVAIGNPVILAELRKIPRAETVEPDYFTRNPNTPKISGGRAFGSVLEAIGMGILSAEHELHAPFSQEMIATLTMRSINETPSKTENSHKPWFIEVVKEETKILINAMKQAAASQQQFSPDFRFYALKVFLRGFYPNASWKDEWIHQLSQAIEDISDSAFKHVVDPYANVEKLRKEAKLRLDPFIDLIMQEDQSFFLSKDYVAHTTPDILRQIIISLLFAGGDNIKKYLDHVFVEFGNESIRNRYLKEKPSAEYLKILIQEIGRLHTTIYAQPGKALEDFTIEYKGKKILIKAGDELHYTTWVANRDTMEWGPKAGQFNPEEHQPHYTKLNPLATFGSGSRVCRGKYLTLAMIEYITEQALELFSWDALVNKEKNHHPTEFNFNNGVKGKIEYTFRSRPQAPLVTPEAIPETAKEKGSRTWGPVSEFSPGMSALSGLFSDHKLPAEPPIVPTNDSTKEVTETLYINTL
ncbi:cytochrome P450 [Legionella maioricensis]|uniref:Cytochrome P450 n=1 Tax=Legionella maioricensis TaxID=2896528 RepID=A0A9X2D019_9GAMM|nr:cytochrome P450 [Legionella maioricensis]MCL9683867.1 cytochrome P450 [Legionella maioricensis]MCL9686714.1 cytochrome P450 [Legionella maioricensis]